VEVVKVEGGIAVFLSEYLGDIDILEFTIEEGPFIIESDHGFNAFLTLLLERCRGGDLRGGVRCRCTFQIDYLRCCLLG